MTKNAKRQKRRKASGVATLMRAIILEGFGIIVLIFILTVSGTDSVSANTESGKRPVLQQIRNWLDQSWAALGNEPGNEVQPMDSAAETEVTANPFPMNEYETHRQFKVKRAVGYEY